MDPTEETEIVVPPEEPVEEAPDTEVVAPVEAAEGAEGAAKPSVSDAVEAALAGLNPKKPDAVAKPEDEEDGERNPDGTFKAKKEEPKLDADGKPIADDKAKKVDHVNDPIPPQVSERTRERITSLVSQVKEQTGVIENQAAVINAIQSTGTTPEEFGSLVGYLQLVHSDKPADLESAYKMLMEGARGIAVRLGKSLPGTDLLEGNQDLIDAVASGQITSKHAEELAISRARTAQENRVKQQTQSVKQTKETAEAERNAVITELNATGDQLRQTDPMYQAKYDAIVPYLTEQFKTTPPNQWKSIFTATYNATRVAPAAPKPGVGTPPAGAPPKPKTTPIRPQAPAGGEQRKAPSSALEAINMALEGNG